jgi:short-subunit dehydrogenase
LPLCSAAFEAVVTTATEETAPGWALVTGACSGIGLEIARELARRGYPLLLVSNRAGPLEAAARELTAQHGVPAQTVCLDLASHDAACRLYEEIRRRGLDIDIFVSNAGMFFYGEVADTDPARAETMLQLHVVTPSLLALRLARDMRAKRRGHILFVSSISAWRDFPEIAYYGSSKRYLRSFSASLREELAIWGVNVTCLAPGATATGLYEHTSIPVDLAVRYGVMKDPAGVARAGVRGMLAGKAVVIPGLSAKAMAVAMRLLPGWLIKSAHRRSQRRPA